MSTSPPNGQPRSRQAVNQVDYRKPLVLGYTIKSGNGLIKPATPQQTFWFCLLRAAPSLGWMKIRWPFFFCALLPGVSCWWSMYSKTHCAQSHLFTLCSDGMNIRGELVINRRIHWAICYGRLIDLLRACYKCQMCWESWLWYQGQQFTVGAAASTIWSTRRIKRTLFPFIFTHYSGSSGSIKPCG